MKRLRITFLVALAAVLSWVPPAAAQVTVTTLAEGDTPVDQTDQIRVAQFLDLTEVNHLAVDDVLSEFDEITALSEDVRIELTCANGSVLEFGEGFRVMVTAPETGDCAVIVSVAGQGDVLTEERTEANIGGTALITKRTRYAFRLRRDGDQPKQEVLVFDGEVEVRSPETANVAGRRELIGAGRVVELAQQGGTIETRPVQPGEIQWWAKRYASFDVVKARAAGTELDDLEALALQDELTVLHAAVLSDPKKTELRAELAETQSTYRVDREASYHTQKVLQLDPAMLQHYPRLENLIRDPDRFQPNVPDNRPEVESQTLIQYLERQQFERVIHGFEIRREQGTATALDFYSCAAAYKKLGKAEEASELARWALRSGTASSLSEEQQETLRELAAPP